MSQWASLADKARVEAEAPVGELWSARSMYEQLCETAARVPARPAVSFQLKSGPKDKATTLSWAALKAQVTSAANGLRALGIGKEDVVAYMLPTTHETLISLMAGMTAGIVHPINPLLAEDQIAALLRETQAKVLITLRPFPKTDLAERAHAAVAQAPNVKTVIEIDLLPHLTPPLSWIVPLIRPKLKITHQARVMPWAELLRAPGDALSFDHTPEDNRYSAYFHTGGTTGMPKIAQHRASGMLYNGWLGHKLLYSETDVVFCPLPLFHVFAAYPIWSGCLMSGAHMVLPTPQGYRGEGVFDNFWKLIERWGATFLVTVPTAAAALMQRPVDADVSSLKNAFCGSAPLPIELFKRFQKATGVQIVEGYGLTEATCLVSINPLDGERKVGSIGIPFPHTDVQILHCDETGAVVKRCGVDEIGEICVANPGVNAGETYTEAAKNTGLYANGTHLRTGDLGRIDADGYLWITGRAKDLIIRGGHNIDPAIIEQALAGHPDVAFAGAIGQPDARAGELPCAYVELVQGASADVQDLMDYITPMIEKVERAALPKYLEIMDELPKTAVGKVFKPDLRRSAITRIYNEALEKGGLDARVVSVIEDKQRGLVARVAMNGASEAMITAILGDFTRPWEAV